MHPPYCAFVSPSPCSLISSGANSRAAISPSAPLLGGRRALCLRARPRRRPSHRAIALSAAGGRSGAGTGGDSCGQQIADAFIAACTPSQKSYAEQLADFSRAVHAAYRRGFSLTALQLELGGTDSTALLGRPLQSDEVELRSVWLTLAYKTMRCLGLQPGNGASVSGGGGGDVGAAAGGGGVFDRDRMDDFVQSICVAAEKGYDQKRIQLEQSLSASESSQSKTPLENAILQQSVRIVLTTIAVAKENGTSP